VFNGVFAEPKHQLVEAAHGVGADVAVQMEEPPSDWNRDDFFGKSLMVLPEHDSVAKAHHVELWVKLLPTIMGVCGILLGYLAYMFVKTIPELTVKRFKRLHTLFFRKWFFDEIYDLVFVRSSVALGNLFWKGGDQKIIDGFGPDGVSLLSKRVAVILGRFQTGYVFQYAFVMMIGLVALVSWVAFRAGLFGQ
jgi:NADH-quinone oxidoreductase subunit L